MYVDRAINGTWKRHGAGARTTPAAPVAASVAACAEGLHCDFHAPDALPAALAAQWDMLADNAAEPNAFAERWFLEPSLALLADKGDVRVAAISSTDGMLIGLMPLAVKPDYGRIRVRNVQNWLHHNNFLGSPMVRKGMEQAFWRTLLDALNASDWATGLLHIDGLTEHGRLLSGLRAASPRCDIVHRVERAMLRTGLDAESYWAETVRKKKRKELNRLANRLADEGAVAYATLGPGEDANPWIEAFLDLECQGWKGEAGSALCNDPKIADFFREICGRAHRQGKLDFHRLDLDVKPIAMLVNFLSAPGGFSFKIAFDEAYARFSPGVLIERYNLRILEREDIGWMDSCASEDHPMIDSLWTARRSIVRVTVPLDGFRNRVIFHGCRAAEKGSAMWKRMRGMMEVCR